MRRCGGCGNRIKSALREVTDKNGNHGYLCISCCEQYATLLESKSIRRFWMCGACGYRILAGTRIDAEVDPESRCPECGSNVNITLVNLSGDHPIESGILGEPLD